MPGFSLASRWAGSAALVLILTAVPDKLARAQALSPGCAPSDKGSNPCPVSLKRPLPAALSAMARLGRDLFYDKGLSRSGRLSCASCHAPNAHFAMPGHTAFALGGEHMDRLGTRTVPSLTYRERQPPFSIGPDDATSETAPLPPAPPGSKPVKSALDPVSSAQAIVPQGGLFWDGRSDTLQAQASGPLFDPREMDSTRSDVIARLRHAPYTPRLYQFAGVQASSDMLLAEALFALARYQTEEIRFHPYSSRYDLWLEGRTTLTRDEADGLALFNAPEKGNCAACHPSRVTPDGLPPLFTDHQYEALAAPRSPQALPGSYDLGLCTAGRQDIGHVNAYCGFFRTPSLRNTATRTHYFHNGAFSSLRAVLDFYVLRDVEPQRFYPKNKDGAVILYDDLPTNDRFNVDTDDAPFGKRTTPALTGEERDKIVAFLKTLTDAPP